ncbi:unnamed protein product [Cylindrotheca closterium]|uniref:Uncharacterized protein n=1 Tax=Cylindrotheca closterium TaxID=2856 RepID=A0AAD2CMQ8_9STRA|nr:unnamed protein product [Cylindrotheca closterium]
MEDPKQIKLSVYKGWGRSEKIDAKINIYQVQHQVPDPLAKVELEETLKAALRFSANAVRRTTYKESFGTLMSSILFMCAFLVAVLWFMISHHVAYNRSNSHLANIIMILIVFVWIILYERFVILPRSKERYEHAARELDAGFRTRGRQLEFVTESFDSPLKAVAFFKLTPVAPSSSSDGKDANAATIGFPNVEDGEVWVCASSLNAAPYLSSFFHPKAPSLLDGVPASMKSSVDLFLWGLLTEACGSARTKYFHGQVCWRSGVKVLSVFVLVTAIVGLTMYYSAIGGDTAELGALFYLGIVIAVFLGSIYFYYGMLSITQAMVAKQSFHPEMPAIVKEFEPKFADAGFRMEYIMEDQEIPLEYVRKGSCKSGQGFFPICIGDQSGLCADF